VLLVLAEERAASATEEKETVAIAHDRAVRSRIAAGDHFTIVRESRVGALATLIAEALVSHPIL
jgi:hypothetical protein